MPRGTLGGLAGAGEAFEGTTLPTWQVTGLSLAVMVSHVLNGSGALVFGLLAVGVIWTLHRLRGYAPHSRTTADLISSAPGAAPARAIRVVQFTAYVLIGASTATSVAGLTLVWFTDSNATPPGWSGPAISVTTVALAAALVAALPTRRLAPVATALAAIGLLAYFCVSLAVIAKAVSGAPQAAPSTDIEVASGSIEWGPAAILIALAIVFAGFEIPTTVNDRLASVRRPLGIAVGLVAVCATTAWAASNMATAGDFRYDATNLVIIVSDMFGESASLWLLAATIALTVAALLVLVWGATRVIRPATAATPLPLVLTAVATGVLAFALSTGSSDVAATSWQVAGLLLLSVYVAVAQANSRLDDSSTSAWAWFALTGVGLAVVAFVTGASQSWWPVLVTLIIVAAAGVWAIQSRKTLENNTPPTPVTKPRPVSKSERLRRENRTS
jgi:hypothetical protein